MDVPVAPLRTQRRKVLRVSLPVVCSHALTFVQSRSLSRMTLAGFIRGRTMNIYPGEHRMVR